MLRQKNLAKKTNRIVSHFYHSSIEHLSRMYRASIEDVSEIYRKSIGKPRLMSGGREMGTGPETWNRLSKDNWSTTRKTTPFSDAVFSYPQPTRPLRTR